MNYDSIVQGLREAIEYEKGNIQYTNRAVKFITTPKCKNNNGKDCQYWSDYNKKCKLSECPYRAKAGKM